MPSDFPEPDVRGIWQNQPTQPSVLTLEKIRWKTGQLRAQTRQARLKTLPVPLVLAPFLFLRMEHLPDAGLRPVMAVAAAWSLAGLYFLNRGMSAPGLPADAALSAGFEFYRHAIERRRALFRRALIWSFGPLLLAVATLGASLVRAALKGKGLLNAMPFLTLTVIWIGAYFVIRMREQRELQREIEELDELRRTNG